jgi:hypothetical protein
MMALGRATTKISSQPIPCSSALQVLLATCIDAFLNLIRLDIKAVKLRYA